jgi:hypothetical protein
MNKKYYFRTFYCEACGKKTPCEIKTAFESDHQTDRDYLPQCPHFLSVDKLPNFTLKEKGEL